MTTATDVPNKIKLVSGNEWLQVARIVSVLRPLKDANDPVRFSYFLNLHFSSLYRRQLQQRCFRISLG